jgi:hypothetical protein
MIFDLRVLKLIFLVVTRAVSLLGAVAAVAP